MILSDHSQCYRWLFVFSTEGMNSPMLITLLKSTALVGFYMLYPGAGIYAIRPDPPGPIPKNGLILSAENGIILDFVSNSSQSVVGVITTPAGASGWRTVYPFNRPGLLRYRREQLLPLPASDQGIYTCTISDSTGQNIVLNVGLYPPDFSGELMLK